MTGESHEVLTNVEGGVGFVTLNRPKAINSLNQTMVDLLATVLMSWEHEDAVHAVVLSGAGERGLCAGGDVVAVYHSARKDGVEARRFWRHEYLLNALIGRFAKPYVALMDGIVMGGGVGVSAHANTRVVTDTSKVAMPEVGIGFIPDVGGVYLLSRAPGALVCTRPDWSAVFRRRRHRAGIRRPLRATRRPRCVHAEDRHRRRGERIGRPRRRTSTEHACRPT